MINYEKDKSFYDTYLKIILIIGPILCLISIFIGQYNLRHKTDNDSISESRRDYYYHKQKILLLCITSIIFMYYYL